MNETDQDNQSEGNFEMCEISLSQRKSVEFESLGRKKSDYNNEQHPHD